ncbi:CUB domain-containing protein [Strongyloides ratti]|uniref:CUB domain-containing protein n=1 Tax=Strongyloides ratti TaxID=34506 RepID=A0A090L6V3_STRRB|nr:CUB domain-containing protein [Strongyloides ratti]CEF63184.1 CUB domain-containing protein [Strongyloides ratti]
MFQKIILGQLFILIIAINDVLSYVQNYDKLNCPSILHFDEDGHHGSVYSPNYPSNYSDGDECEFLIKVPENYTIQLIVYDFITESCCDTLYIYNGAGNNLIEVLQGVVTPGTIINSNNESEIFLRFMSDLTNTYKGFYIDYHAVPIFNIQNPTTKNPLDKSDCPLTILNETVAGISSPNWPDLYPLDITCDYLLGANNTENYVSLEFITFSTESCCDYVKIYDNINGDDESKLIAQVKGSNLTQTIFTSTTPNMFLRFYSDLTNNYKGFNAIFHLIPFPTYFIHKPVERKNITII